MALLNWLLACLNGEVRGWFAAVERFHTDVIDGSAAYLGISATVLYIVGIVCAVLIGVLAYRLVKLFLALLGGGLGYLIGTQLFWEVRTEAMPEWLAYVFGGVVALAFLWLTFGRASYLWFGIMAVVGFCAVRFWLTEDLWIGVGGGFLLAILSMRFFRLFYMLTTGLGCGFLAAGCLAAVLPEVAVLQPASDNVGYFAISLGAAAVFCLAQYLLHRRRRRRA
ncbi:MAG: hypothetical protein IJX28_03100 [Clostridia bacterium]|nr:hypothetical protein [Clostridia bacterium]